ncbi:Cytochrome P450 9e2 [Harpegnathos saltator]|uniref:Cytochrome P450 9e2 n=1 Tax=Harpegnathos saltator TaxID=610380 RepID=E2C4V3_HARSA|nr:Cytochrome P450 9e2 [Harpegnathos saltator]
MLRDPELIKSIALKYFDMFMDHRSFVKDDQDPLMSNNLFSLRGDKWREIRAVLSPAFTSSKMKNMFKLMSDYATDFVKFIMELPAEQRVMEMKDIFTRYTTDGSFIMKAEGGFWLKMVPRKDPHRTVAINVVKTHNL